MRVELNFKSWRMLAIAFFVTGCTIKAVGDPERPITINAHVTVDIRGLQNTATDIEGYVSGEKSQNELPVEP